MTTRGGHDPLFQAIFGGCFVLAGIGIVGYQTFAFLKYGEWPSASIIDVAKLAMNHPWLWAPTDWNGLHWLLDKIPASVVLLAIGYTIVISE